MKIEIDEKKLISESMIKGITNSEEFQNQIEKILESDECRQIIKEKMEEELKEFLLTDDGKKVISDIIKRYLEDYDPSYDNDVIKEFSDIVINTMRNVFDINKTKE